MDKNLASALLKAQAGMGKLIKDSKNPHFKSSYASLTAVLDTVRPALTDAGVVLYQSASAAEGLVIVRSMLIHAETGESIEEQLALPVGQATAQSYGSAITYGRRYLAMAMCGLAPDDDDGEASGQQAKTQPQPRTVAQHRPARAPVAEHQPPTDEEPEDNPFTDEVPPKVKSWGHDASKAKAWAVEVGACANDFEASNSLKKIVQAHGGRLTTANAAEIFTAFYLRQQEKLSEAAEAVAVETSAKIPF